LGNPSSQVTTYVANYNKLIATSYKLLNADQNQAGLTTNWYVPNSGNLATPGTTGCSGSGTPADQYGSEAARGPWRVTLDWLWFPSEATQAPTYLAKLATELSGKFTGSTFNNLDTGGLVNSVFANWLQNPFIYGPTFCSLVKPISGLSNQQAALNWGANLLNGVSITEYYGGSWTVISTLTISGDLAKAASYVGSGSSTPPPVPTAPVKPPAPVPTAPVKPPAPVPTAPVKPPAPSPTKSGAVCSVTGQTYTPTNMNFVVSGVSSVTSAQVQCSGSTMLTCTSLGSNIYQCKSSTACQSPVPYVNGSPCPITLGTASQSCGASTGTNTWWVEFTPPGTGWTLAQSNVRCPTTDGSVRFYACTTNYGTKIACPISDSPCTGPIPYYNDSPCPFPSSIIGDQVAHVETTSTGMIIGVSVTCAVILIGIIVAIVVKKKLMAQSSEIV